MSNVVNEQSIKKLELLFTIVDRSKTEFYVDVLSQLQINSQFVVSGLGTATSEFQELLGLNKQKAVIISVVKKDVAAEALKVLQQKFETVKKGKGIAFCVPMSSIIGINAYQFLSDNRLGKECFYAKQ